MNKEMHPLVQLAKKAVESYVKNHELVRVQELSPEMKTEAGVFVSLKRHGQLRGCIGTSECRRRNYTECHFCGGQGSEV